MVPNIFVLGVGVYMLICPYFVYIVKWGVV